MELSQERVASLGVEVAWRVVPGLVELSQERGASLGVEVLGVVTSREEEVALVQVWAEPVASHCSS